MNAEPQAVLALVYWLHLLATVIWIGSLASLALFVAPAARRSLAGESGGIFLGQVQARIQNAGWLSLGMLVATGLFQMSANPNYKGFLAIVNTWAVAILAKHVVVGVMLLVNTYLTFSLAPARKRAELRQGKGLAIAADLDRLRGREWSILWANVALSGVVLALTALARASQ